MPSLSLSQPFTFLETERVGLVEEHRVEHEGAVLTMLHGGVTGLALSDELLCS